jgi:hypothetical protein
MGDCCSIKKNGPMYKSDARLFVFRVSPPPTQHQSIASPGVYDSENIIPLAPPEDFYFKPPTETCTFVMRAFSQSSVNICAGILMILLVQGLLNENCVFTSHASSSMKSFAKQKCARSEFFPPP